jgi:hypothetical protein
LASNFTIKSVTVEKPNVNTITELRKECSLRGLMQSTMGLKIPVLPTAYLTSCLLIHNCHKSWRGKRLTTLKIFNPIVLCTTLLGLHTFINSIIENINASLDCDEKYCSLFIMKSIVLQVRMLKNMYRSDKYEIHFNVQMNAKMWCSYVKVSASHMKLKHAPEDTTSRASDYVYIGYMENIYSFKPLKKTLQRGTDCFRLKVSHLAYWFDTI